MQSITFVIFTFNEEKRIERVVKNFKNFGKVLLADDNSTDRTHEIAKSYGCDIYIRPKSYEFVENQELVNLIYEQVTTEWIFWGYADEMMDNNTLVKIKSIISSNRHDIIGIDRKNYFYGEFVYDLYHSRTNRIFKKGAIDFSENVIHGFGTPTVKPERIFNLPKKYFIHQFINYTAATHINSVNKYTETEVKFSNKSHKSLWFLFFKILKNILKNYLLGKGYKAGFAGLALTELTLFYELIKNIKIYEHANNLNKVAIEAKNDEYRELILKGIEN